MGKRWKLWGTIFCALLVIAALVIHSEKPEPSYQGKTLSEWLLLYECVQVDQERADDAIRHIGTNAIPYLLEWIQFDEPAWKSKLRESAMRLIGKRDDHYNELGEIRTYQAVQAFRALGSSASSAIGELTRLMNQTNNMLTVCRATDAVGYVGPHALPALMSALTSQQVQLRKSAAYAISHLGTNAGPAIPLLIAGLKDRNNVVAYCNAYALGELHLEPRLVVPALNTSLDDPSAFFRFHAAEALRKYGVEARPATSALRKLLNDPVADVRSEATNALRAIAPEALTNAPPQ